MIKTILVATDGSEAAGAAEDFGLGLAGRLQANASGITVIEDRDVRAPKVDGLSVAAFPETELQAYYRSRGDAVAQRFSQRAQAANASANCDVSGGIADEAIIERSQASDVVVVGRNGKGEPYGGSLVGATTARLIRKTSRSTVVVPSGASLGGPVVLGFDGSPGSRIAATLAIQLATGLGESIHIFVDSKDKGRAVARFEEVRQLLGSFGGSVRETSSTLGRPDVKIVDAAKEANAGLIVMGAFGRNRISEYFLGSNAASVVRISPVAVLLAR
ncbi:MAG: universal stress protein [Myxococcota bacterium]|nr:universal stress protein [Myxococcota bacterium]